ncbi:MAG TPA: hypothetical protein VNV66_01495 [Pilimelia sp.]|nr:hypothetical protein [Pilimelia sp.]
MSNPVTPGTPGRVVPSTVRFSSYLLYAAAAAQLIGAVVALSTAGTYREVVEEQFAGVDGGEAIAGVTAASAIVGAVVGLLLGAGFVVLAIFNSRGKNASRITTWAVGGLSICCGGINLVSVLTGGTLGMNTSAPGQPSPEQLSAALEAALPGWYFPVLVAATLLGLLSLIGAVILLALPPSNEFFRKPPPAWEPPAPGYQPYQG